MAWQQWVYLAFAAASTVASVSSVGKPREPLTAEIAAGIVVIQALLVWLILSI